MHFQIPNSLVSACGKSPERRAWLDRLPDVIEELQARWSLSIGEPFDGPDVSSAWVAPVESSSGPAVLKVGMPHMEAHDEIAGLRFWNGDPTVHLLQAEVQHNAMLLERCEPGTSLRELPDEEQDRIVAHLLRRLWRKPSDSHAFRPLTDMLRLWGAEADDRGSLGIDRVLFDEGLRLLAALPASADQTVLLATDVHAGNVLRAQRAPWLMIDPKPFVGDPAYDATQHLLNGPRRLLREPHVTIHRFSEMLEVDPVRVRRWTFARLATMPVDGSDLEQQAELVRLLAPS